MISGKKDASKKNEKKSGRIYNLIISFAWDEIYSNVKNAIQNNNIITIIFIVECCLKEYSDSIANNPAYALCVCVRTWDSNVSMCCMYPSPPLIPRTLGHWYARRNELSLLMVFLLPLLCVQKKNNNNRRAALSTSWLKFFDSTFQAIIYVYSRIKY